MHQSVLQCIRWPHAQPDGRECRPLHQFLQVRVRRITKSRSERVQPHAQNGGANPHWSQPSQRRQEHFPQAQVFQNVL